MQQNDDEVFVDVLDDPEPALPAVVRRMRQRRMWHFHNRRAAMEQNDNNNNNANGNNANNNVAPRLFRLRPPAQPDVNLMADAEDDMLAAAFEMAEADIELDDL